jgi:hypothetical protein
VSVRDGPRRCRLRIAEALSRDAGGVSQGGIAFEMQLTRNLFLADETTERTLSRKLKEALAADYLIADRAIMLTFRPTWTRSDEQTQAELGDVISQLGKQDHGVMDELQDWVPELRRRARQLRETDGSVWAVWRGRTARPGGVIYFARSAAARADVGAPAPPSGFPSPDALRSGSPGPRGDLASHRHQSGV